ncbi:MAG: family 10 glycosylhydrolase [Candidatus Melainabacteria bacterium]|nr:family 10 glycosylhydrolase [Candidatus Melainabacteria bacterium]
MTFFNAAALSKHLPPVLSLSVGLALLASPWATLSAQVAYEVTPAFVLGNGTLRIQGKNVQRPDNAIVLYDSDYGASTRTNNHGVELMAKPVAGKAHTYRVMSQTNVWTCQAQKREDACGNAPIPAEGVVLSATGDKRKPLMDALPVGSEFALNPVWFQQRRVPFAAINPDMTTNPRGSGFPGFRGGNQLVIYNDSYGNRTGTNEYGFEVTVQEGTVVTRDGANSVIPPGGYVLSGHGSMRQWLIENAPVGARIRLDYDTKTVNSELNLDTYRFRLANTLARLGCGLQPATAEACRNIELLKAEAEQNALASNPTEAAWRLQQAINRAEEASWKTYSAFPKEAVKAVWHRPVEKTRVAVGETLDRLKASGLNTVFLETFFHGYTIFPSDTYRKYGLPIVQNPKFASGDLLSWWVDEAHKRGMKVHVWFQTFYVGHKQVGGPGPILSRYPQWANVQYSALYFPPAPPLTPVTAPALQNASPSKSASLSKSATLSKGSAENPLLAPVTLNETTPLRAKRTALPPVLAQPAPAIGKSTLGESSTATPLPDSLAASSDTSPLLPVAPPVPPPAVVPSRPTPSTVEAGAYFLDPANPEVREFVLDLVSEIASRYAVDGIQLDYIRYPGSFPPERFSYLKTTWGYTTVARKAFEQQYGIDPTTLSPEHPLWANWMQFKADQVNRVVEDASRIVHQTAKQKNRTIWVSAAIFPETDKAYIQKHQAWGVWARQGWVDALAPMSLTGAVSIVGENVRRVLDSTQQRVPVWSGVFAPFNNLPPERLLEQVSVSQQTGAKGFAVFDSAHLTGRMGRALSASQQGAAMTGQTLPTVPLP